MSLKHILYVISPVIAGFIFLFLKNIFVNQSIILSLFFSIIFLVYWFYVGTKFHDFYSSTFFTIIVGNLFFVATLVLFFLVPFINTTNIILVSLYNFFSKSIAIFLPFVSFILKRASISTNDNFSVVIFSIVIPILLFIIGYIFAKKRSKRGRYTLDKKLFR